MPVLLTVITDTPDRACTEQLEKIYADAQADRLAQLPGADSAEAFVEQILQNPQYDFYCGLFNDRLIAAVVVNKVEACWEVSHLCVRRVTRRRGVGSRLLALVMDAARAEQKNLRIPSQALMTPDHIILQRMGYQLNEAGDFYHLSSR